MRITHGFHFARALLALALCAALGACGGGGGGGGGGQQQTAVISLDHTSLSFGTQSMGATSPAQLVTVSNVGTATLVVSSVTLGGTNAALFADTSTCSSVAPSGNCTISVTFTPNGAGADSATLSINSNATVSPFTVMLAGTGEATTANTVAATIDSGPTVNGAPLGTLNILFVTVHVCAPGSTTNCQDIDHVQVDTGSTGLRLLSSVLNANLAAALTPVRTASMAAGHALIECSQFADGYSWGPVKVVDMTLGSATVAGLPVHVIGDPTYPSTLAPTACTTSGPSPTEEDTVTAFGANGLIGIGYFLQDCGPNCASDGSAYNDCTPTACVGYFASLAEQLPNPVSLLPSGSNGVQIQLPTVAEAVDTPVSGTIVFGVGAAAGSLPGNVSVFQVNPGNGTFTADYASTSFTSSFVDSGSNGWYFPNQAPAIATCANPDQAFYCPTGGSVQLSATIHDWMTPTHTATVGITLYDFSQFTNSTVAASGLGGILSGSGLTSSFDFGLPFFFGKNVYVAFENTTLNGAAAPAFAY